MQRNNDGTIFIEKIQLNQFRCFDNATIDLDNPIVLIEGDNGTGKTSLLEALHYTCYLRSFRTHLQKELVRGNENTFFVKVLLRNQDLHHNVQVGFSHTKRVVRIDGKAISSYKELMDYYRIISITEDDIELIKGAPELRRDFLDSALFLIDPDFLQKIKKLRKIVENRNGLLRHPETFNVPQAHLTQGHTVHRIHHSRNDALRPPTWGDQSLARVSGFCRTGDSEKGRGRRYFRGCQSVRDHLGRQEVSRCDCRENQTLSRYRCRSRARNHRLLRLHGGHDRRPSRRDQSRRRSDRLRTVLRKLWAGRDHFRSDTAICPAAGSGLVLR